MTKNDKLIKKLLISPKDFTWDELVKVLYAFGFELKKTGKTGGSRRKFENKNNIPISLHEPHNPSILKPYAIKQVIEILKKEKLI